MQCCFVSTVLSVFCDIIWCWCDNYFSRKKADSSAQSSSKGDLQCVIIIIMSTKYVVEYSLYVRGKYYKVCWDIEGICISSEIGLEMQC